MFSPNNCEEKAERAELKFVAEMNMFRVYIFPLNELNLQDKMNYILWLKFHILSLSHSGELVMWQTVWWRANVSFLLSK